MAEPADERDAERQARYAAYVAARTEADLRDRPMPDDRTVAAAIRAYRATWLAAHDAAVRAKVAAEILDNPGPDPSPASPAWWAGWVESQQTAAAIARQTREETTTPPGCRHPAEPGSDVCTRRISDPPCPACTPITDFEGTAPTAHDGSKWKDDT